MAFFSKKCSLTSWFCKCWLFLTPLWIRQGHVEVRLWRNGLSLLSTVRQCTNVHGEHRICLRRNCLWSIASRARRQIGVIFFQIMHCGAPLNCPVRVLHTAALCALSVWGLLTSRSVWGWVSVRWKRGLGDGSVLAAGQQQVPLTSTGTNKGPFVGAQQLQNTQFVISSYLGVGTEDLPQHLQPQHTVCLCCVVRFGFFSFDSLLH